ncbi:hypothetical protein [Nocardia tenerifensis]|nr:hypothetical protein [Nocardia tenerifensis]
MTQHSTPQMESRSADDSSSPLISRHLGPANISRFTMWHSR